MLSSHLTVGTTIRGLSNLLDGGGGVGADQGQVSSGIAGSYTVAGRQITFFADHSGDIQVNILPYVAGAISYTQMGGRETISGEFTGCTMAIYNDAGTTRVCHVDTARPSQGEAPSKARWASMKEVDGFEMADELATSGMIAEFLDTRVGDMNPADRANLMKLSVLAVATPVHGIRSCYVVKADGAYTIVG